MSSRNRKEDGRPPFSWRLWKPGEQIRIMHQITAELMPAECHIKEDGSVAHMPSICFVMRHANGATFVSQITEHMLRPVLRELEASVKRREEALAPKPERVPEDQL